MRNGCADSAEKIQEYPDVPAEFIHDDKCNTKIVNHEFNITLK